jgi:hypothetical protein
MAYRCEERQVQGENEVIGHYIMCRRIIHQARLLSLASLNLSLPFAISSFEHNKIRC